MRKVPRTSLGPAHLTYTSDMNSPVNSAPWSDCLKALSKSEETKNVAPFGDTSKGTHVEAEMDKTGSTFTFILTTLDVLGFSEDTDYERTRGCY